MPVLETYGSTKPQPSDTRRVLLGKIVLATVAGGGGGGGGSGQIVAYTTTDPNTDGVVPTDPTKPAIAVKPNSTLYVWTPPAGPWT